MNENSSLARTLETLSQHHHCCLIFEGRHEQLAAVVPFLRLGLARGEKCLCLMAESQRPLATAALRRRGADLAAARIFAPQSQQRGLHMGERFCVAGGQFSLRSSPGAGARIGIRIPFPPEVS